MRNVFHGVAAVVSSAVAEEIYLDVLFYLGKRAFGNFREGVELK